MRRFLTAGLLTGSFVLVAVAAPATASAAVPPGWCLGPAPCTVLRTAGAQTTDGWCLTPGEDICRRY